MSTRYEEHRPRQAPGRYVACLWTQVNATAHDHAQLVVPDGCVDLVWQDGELQLVGPDRAAWTAPLAAGSAIAGLRLRPGSAPLLLGRMPAEEVRDLRVPLAEVLAAGGGTAADPAGRSAPLAERLASAATVREAAAVLDGYVAGLALRYQVDEAVQYAVAELRRGGTPRLPDLAARAGLSERQLRRRFAGAVGYAPKTLHAILRFQHALGIGRSMTGKPRLAEVAYEAGYADQAHFTREVRRLAGTTPTVLLGVAELTGGAAMATTSGS